MSMPISMHVSVVLSMDVKIAVFLLLVSESLLFGRVFSASVTYDGRALIIDGKRRVLQSGSVHYPRTTPEVWPEIIRKSREGGLDVIESYVFWNYHEPVKGEYYFEGRFDLVRFVKTVQEAGLFVHLRIGPYACAEWNYGGFPIWLHFMPDIQFRTNNDLFKNEMKTFLTKIVSMMKEEKLFASQGGPIILAQVENEYGNVEGAYGVGGELYVKWAAETAVNLNTDVPWVMCAQKDAPDPVINTCNGAYCDGFAPNSKSKPTMWTENYAGWFLGFGLPIPYRPVEDIAFAVARFFERGGTFQNYYMYFGGTNFGRTAGGPLVATSYDYDAPIDEYGEGAFISKRGRNPNSAVFLVPSKIYDAGFIRQPKWGHLRDLHKAIKMCEDYLVSSDPTYLHLGMNLEAHIYYKKSNECAAFLANYDSHVDANVTFNGYSYFLPAWSVSILPDCTNVIFNTAKVVSQSSHGENPFARARTHSGIAVDPSTWTWYKEKVGLSSNNSFVKSYLLEQINTTKDTSDFLWYTTSINVKEKMKPTEEKEFLLFIASLGHAALVFVNKSPVGFGYGNHEIPSFSFSKSIKLKQGNNTLDVLSMIIGLQNYGPWFDIMGAGLLTVVLSDLVKDKVDLSSAKWTYQVGLEGEHLGLDKLIMENSSIWTKGNSVPVNQSLIWYKAKIRAPEGAGPLALNLASMGKGEAWINGISVGRYWNYSSTSIGCTDHCDYRGTYNPTKCLKNCGQPTQTLYHIPRTWVHSGDNLLVLHEEIGGDPTKIFLLTRTGQEICGHISETDLAPAGSWNSNLDFNSQIPEVHLSCENGWRITSIDFASFGNPDGNCGTYNKGTCHADMISVVQQACIGQEKCAIPVTSTHLGDPCPGLMKSLAIEALCSD